MIKRWLFKGLKLITKPVCIALIAGLLAAWQFSGDYRLKPIWRKPVDPNIKHIVHSSSGTCRLYSKTNPNQSWFVGREVNSDQVEMQVPQGASFWGQDYFSQDGKWYAINGSYQHKSENILFVFETSTGKMVSDIPLLAGSAELACFLLPHNLIVYRDSSGLSCWDLRQNQLHSRIKMEQLFLVFHMTGSSDGDRLYCMGPVMKNMYDDKLETMDLRCWSVAEQRQLFRNSFPSKDLPHLWAVIIDQMDQHLFGVFAGSTTDAYGRHFLDEDVIHCWDAKDGRLIRTYSKKGGESGDPIFPMDIDRYLVFHDSKPNTLRQLWKQWIKSDPGWLKSWLPNQMLIDVRDAMTGDTLQRLSMPHNHWPRFHTSQGTYLETYAKANGQEEIAYWEIEERNRISDALFIGSSTMLGIWIGLLLLGRARVLWRQIRRKGDDEKSRLVLT